MPPLLTGALAIFLRWRSFSVPAQIQIRGVPKNARFIIRPRLSRSAERRRLDACMRSSSTIRQRSRCRTLKWRSRVLIFRY